MENSYTTKYLDLGKYLNKLKFLSPKDDHLLLFGRILGIYVPY